MERSQSQLYLVAGTKMAAASGHLTTMAGLAKQSRRPHVQTAVGKTTTAQVYTKDVCTTKFKVGIFDLHINYSA